MVELIWRNEFYSACHHAMMKLTLYSNLNTACFRASSFSVRKAALQSLHVYLKSSKNVTQGYNSVKLSVNLFKTLYPEMCSKAPSKYWLIMSSPVNPTQLCCVWKRDEYDKLCSFRWSTLQWSLLFPQHNIARASLLYIYVDTVILYRIPLLLGEICLQPL